MNETQLHTYQCSNCKSTMTTPAKGPSRCIYCYTPMRWMWADPIDTEARQALAARGVVYNPGVSKAVSR